MSTFDNNNSKTDYMKNFGWPILLLLFSMFLGINTFAEDSSPAANETMKSVFAEVKKDVSSNTNISSILMIVGVIAIVGVAVYLSFNGGEEGEKDFKLKKLRRNVSRHKR